MPLVKVAVDVPLPTLFDYRCEDAAPQDVGLRVLAPFGRKQVVGIAMAVGADAAVEDVRIRAIGRWLRDVPPLPPEVLELLRFCCEYYHHPIGEVVMGTLPARLRSPRPIGSRAAPAYAPTAAGRDAAAAGALRRSPALRRLWESAVHAGVLDPAAVAALTAAERRALTVLRARGWVEQAPAQSSPPAPAVPGPALNEYQQRAVDAILGAGAGFRAWLLHGITGSGKTEVYFRLAAATLAAGGQVLLLVPEINLTPQLEALIDARFPGVARVSLHSGLADGERTAGWLAAQSGEARIVLGTRSAIFAPLPRLGLVIVDEEHDGSFKQIEGFRYHARDLAVWRARQHGVPVVLGSATPSLESYQHALADRYTRITLARRATPAPLPRVVLVGTQNERRPEGIARAVLAAIGERLARGEQSLVFVNRRGYAPVLVCRACGWAAGCERCSARLVLHAARAGLECHHCGHREPVPVACPDCGNVDLRAFGHGTQRVEASLREAFPDAVALRVDRDTTRGRDAFRDMRARIERREVDILVGTQLLAKGHDFPGLSLVCVLDADRSLYSTDFRASEQLFAQLVQVAGRAGRGAEQGEVLIQTDFPAHPLYRALLHHDYDAFAQALLAERRAAGFPPFVHQALLRAHASRLERAVEFLEHAAGLAAPLASGVTVYDPAPATLARLKGVERAQLLVQSSSRPRLRRFLAEWVAALGQGRVSGVRWNLDVDPLEL